MAVPDFQSLMLPLLRITSDGQQHTLGEAVERLADEFRLSKDDRLELLRSGQTRLYNRVAWTSTYLRKAGLLKAIGPGRFEVTDRGREVLGTKPGSIDIAFLESHFPEVREFRGDAAGLDVSEEPPAVFDAAEGRWVFRSQVDLRIRSKVEHWIPDEKTRRDALALLAFAIENADEERRHAWFVRETSSGLALMTGRLLACEIRRSRIRLSVIGPIGDDVRAKLGAESADDGEFKLIPGGLLVTFPAEHSAYALDGLRDQFDGFVDMAMARVRRLVSLEDHVPEAVSYVAGVIGRDLPQPEPQTEAGSEEVDGNEDVEDATVSREPRVRGRAPIFEHGQRSIASLMSDVENEVIALPDLQRAFVWEDTKVRDLLDSLFLGFPVGTLVLWHTSDLRDAKTIAAETQTARSTALVIDGQQRLTSLFAVMKGVEVVGKDGEGRRISIAFRPRDGRFEVADAAIRRDPEFLPNVTELWLGKKTKRQIRVELVTALREKGRAIDDAYEEAVEHNLEGLHNISDYRFPTVDIRATSAEEEASEEDVAEIFVRINNQGTRLGQADFVLTLLSVFHPELRDRIEERARSMSDGAIVPVDPQQLLRAACAVAFDRARMSAVYRSLRGVDPVTGVTDLAGRAKQLKALDEAANDCLELTPWRDYLLCVRHAGFVHRELVASRNAIVNAYAFYIRGRRARVPKEVLDRLIARWVFATLLTARYSGASETVFEEDLKKVALLGATDGFSFARALDDTMGETITGDYWTRTLVAALETQKGRAPSALAFRAAQVVLNARAFFTEHLLQNLLDPPTQGGRAASEAHHLFPQAYLFAHGIRDPRRINQVANLADAGWHENNVIGGRGPSEYVPLVRARLKIEDERWSRMCAEHALPIGWERMQYEEFVSERRKRMAEIVRVAFRKLGGEPDAGPVAPPWFLHGAETVWLQIAGTERMLRSVVRAVYVARFGEKAAESIEKGLGSQERETLVRALRARPLGAEPLSVVDYLYIGQLPALLFSSEVWDETQRRLVDTTRAKARMQAAIDQVAPVRNEIAHVREVAADRLMRATLACSDIKGMFLEQIAGR